MDERILPMLEWIACGIQESNRPYRVEGAVLRRARSGGWQADGDDITGFGDTPQEAVQAFDQAYGCAKAVCDLRTLSEGSKS